ncbi:MAG: heme exporter protein CcmD [Pseudomonadota bacterium]
MIPDFEYAAFVWSSYLVFALVMTWQVVQPMLRRRRIKKQLLEQFEEQQAARLMQNRNSQNQNFRENRI